MNTTKKTIFALLLVLAFALVMAVAMAAAEDKNETTVPPKSAKVNSAANNTFVACMNDAVAVKQESFNKAKDVKTKCLLYAKDSGNVSKANLDHSKVCSSDFKKDMNAAKSVFRTERSECLKIKHTMWEGFKAYFQ